MSSTLPKPKARNLYLPEQVNQESMNKLTKAIIEINESDEYLNKLYGLHGIDYAPGPIKMYIDSYGGAVYQCFGLLGVMEKSVTPIHTIVTGAAMSCGLRCTRSSPCIVPSARVYAAVAWRKSSGESGSLPVAEAVLL